MKLIDFIKGLLPKRKGKAVIVPETTTNTVREMSKRYREILSEKLKAENLTFVESDSRMDYGMIGQIFQDGVKF